MPHNVIISMVFLRIPWGHGIRKQPVNVATRGLHSFFSFSFHFSFHNDFGISAKTMSPCQISIYYRLWPPHSISIMGKGSASHHLILDIVDICFIHCQHSVLLVQSVFGPSAETTDNHESFTVLGRHLALPPYESSIRVLKVREFVNSIFPSKFSTDRLFYSTNHRRGPSIMRSRDLF